ncbi:hypothetical protein UFOVP833_31 [uncultured Caudovirales phage]|uniref:Uncharacterized protein n=1 Tax=uncultured Caudovirales phage TaxID=2100421 RepID=A0A6J5SVL7_9CAUD|nr:hypothetical protein UFOVP833_31 [uncultured Caudovirales phage]CAB4218824.1 hypothetical protein UFOVP1603_56 [uncultured Caudovirales phage]
MTEDEAKTKWCPFARQATVFSREGATGGTANRDGPHHYGVPNVECIASACMAWRWEDEDAYDQRLTEWEDAANIGGVQRGPEPMRGGFCGLGGKP